MTKSRSKRRLRRNGGTGAALLRALLLAGPLAIAIVVGLSPRAERSLSNEGIDMTMTGSVKPSGFSFAIGGPASPTAFGACLRTSDAAPRGMC
ncbi:hypothetical protein ACP4J4_17310 [Aureimonas ureilytica]|uniref:hypothetical protein n=1 Tax=Aureimonas ureilytica TaxID=401562 RepID=UPI003CE6A6CF